MMAPMPSIVSWNAPSWRFSDFFSAVSRIRSSGFTRQNSIAFSPDSDYVWRARMPPGGAWAAANIPRGGAEAQDGTVAGDNDGPDEYQSHERRCRPACPPARLRIDALHMRWPTIAERWPAEAAVVRSFRGSAATNAASRSVPRERLAGHFTASAWLVDGAGERVLLTHHRKLDRWLQLGGHADGDRDFARVALREAEEESGLTGLSVEPAIFDLDAHWIPEHKDVPAHCHYDVRFVVRAGGERRLRRQRRIARAGVARDRGDAARRSDAMRRCGGWRRSGFRASPENEKPGLATRLPVQCCRNVRRITRRGPRIRRWSCSPAPSRRCRCIPGTMISMPVDSFAGFGRLVAVPPLSSGGVSITSIATLCGNCIATGCVVDDLHVAAVEVVDDVTGGVADRHRRRACRACSPRRRGTRTHRRPCTRTSPGGGSGRLP